MTKLTGKYLKIQKIVEKELSCNIHDIDHVMRVYVMILKLSKGEKNVDQDILKVATLLHDIARVKEDADVSGKICHAEESAKMSESILKKMGYSPEKIEKVKHCILAHRFKTNNKPETIEAKILFDADKLDSLGCIAIMRAGMWLGRHGCAIFPKENLKEYARKNLAGGVVTGRIKNPSLHNIFHEYEIKYKKIPSQMHTALGKKVGLKRLESMRIFLDDLRKEAEGKL